MKKLMIAAAIVCAAAFVQASQVKWSASKIYTESTIGTESPAAAAGYQYLCFYSVNTLGDHILSQADAIKYLDGTTEGGAKKLATLAAKNGTVTLAGGLSASDNRGTTGTAGEDFWGSGDSAQGYAIIFNTADTDLSKADKYMITTVSALQNFQATNNTKTFALGDQSGNTWKDVASSPEPTSAMLLLLGVAGLALRRRRA